MRPLLTVWFISIVTFYDSITQKLIKIIQIWKNLWQVLVLHFMIIGVQDFSRIFNPPIIQLNKNQALQNMLFHHFVKKIFSWDCFNFLMDFGFWCQIGLKYKAYGSSSWYTWEKIAIWYKREKNWLFWYDLPLSLFYVKSTTIW